MNSVWSQSATDHLSRFLRGQGGRAKPKQGMHRCLSRGRPYMSGRSLRRTPSRENQCMCFFM
jgi:hypothetical protein